MPDAVLTRDGPVGVPEDYQVPQSGELLPLTVRATVDGSGAASAFYATVQVLAPTGRVMGSYISSQIAAGASADVTWFPGITSLAAITPNTGGQWQTYTPIWTAASGTQPSVGNGTLTGLYFQLGAYVTCRVVLTVGSTTTLGTSGALWHFSLPVTGISTPSSANFGLSSVGSHSGTSYFFWGFQDGTTNMATFATSGAAGSAVQFVSNGFPAAWATGDVIRSGCIFEAA